MKKKDVYLVPSRDSTGKVTWIWAHDGQYGTAQNFPVLDLPKDSGKHEITFSIIDPQNQIVFDNAQLTGPKGPYNNAVWIMKKQSGTAKLPGIEQNDQLDPPGFKKSDTQLVLTDKNKGDPIEFVYQLNFKDSQTNQPVTSIDPDLKNGGGGEEFGYSALETLAIALGVAVVAALLSRWADGLESS